MEPDFACADVEFDRAPFTRGMTAYSSLLPLRGGPLACRIMQLAFARGAYVAGGLARTVLTPRGGAPSDAAYEAVKLYVKSFNGDVDLFFSDKRSLDAFWVDYSTDGVIRAAAPKLTTLPSGAAAEITLDEVRIQVVNKLLVPIEEQLRRFDIFNGMVAFNEAETVVPHGWAELEEQNLLHVLNWSSIFVIHRLAKWHHKQGYTGLSPRTAAEIGSVALDIIDALRKNPRPTAWGGQMTHNDVAKKLKRFLPYLSAEQLLLVSTIQPIDSYEGAFGILQRRAAQHDLNNKAEVVVT